MEDTTIYDLGEVSADSAATRLAASTAGAAAIPDGTVRSAARVEAARTTFAPQAYASAEASGFDFAGTLSLFVPGAGHLVHRQWSAGLFFLSSLSFLAVLGWAIIGTIDRLTETLLVLGQPKEFGIWALCLIYVFAAVLHLWSVLSGNPAVAYRDAPPPVVAGIASLLFPGWGQILNGDTKRAALFVSSLWVIGAAWLLALPQTHAVLESQGFYLPSALTVFSSTAVRWTLPAVVWALAVYDAASSAAGRR
jgi:hypothetical protein